MPEGPEVETVRLGLSSVLQSQIEQITISANPKYVSQKSDLKKLLGFKIQNIERKGKFLLWFFRKGKKVKAALNHLGMTGVWYHYSKDRWSEFEAPLQKYKHYKLIFDLTDGDVLLFSDTRTFGQFLMIDPVTIYEFPSIANLGPDMLEIPFNSSLFLEKIRGKNNNRKIEVGRALLNPKIVAGCGNIYKSEALFNAKINPFTTVNNLSEKQVLTLGQCLSEVGELAMKNQGTTLRDYSQVDGYSGLMQNELVMYGRQGQACVDCSNGILSAKQGGRTTYWCPSCQQG